MSKFWFLKLSNNAKLSRTGNMFFLETSVFDPMTDFISEPTSISEYLVSYLSTPNINAETKVPRCFRALEWLQQPDVQFSENFVNLFVKNPLCLLVFRHPPTDEKYQTVFYLKDLKIKSDNLVYILEYDMSLLSDIRLLLSPNWELDIKDGTLFLDQTRNRERISSYLKVSSNIFDGLVLDLPNLSN